MKKLLVLTLCVCALVGCKDEKKTATLADPTQMLRDSMQNIITQKDNEINELMGTLNEIDEGFSLINAAQDKVMLAKQGEGANKQERVRENMALIQQQVQKNKELIEKLKKQLNNSSVKSEQLNRTIENLTKQIEEKSKELQSLREELDKKDIHISELDEKVANLNTNVSTLQEDNTQKAAVISQQDKDLHSAWFVFGTKKELKEQHIIEGGKVLQSNFNKNYFTKIDIRNEKEIKLYSKSAKLLTAHPASSYQLVQDESKQYTLKIHNADAFWSTSKYLVILVK